MFLLSIVQYSNREQRHMEHIQRRERHNQNMVNTFQYVLNVDNQLVFYTSLYHTSWETEKLHYKLG